MLYSSGQLSLRGSPHNEVCVLPRDDNGQVTPMVAPDMHIGDS